MRRNVPSREPQRSRTARILLSILLIATFLTGLLPAPVAGLAAIRQEVFGQVTGVETATVGGEPLGIVLSVERGVNTTERYIPSKSELIIAPAADTSSWTKWRINGSAPLLAIGDVDGDSNDDVALGFASGGGSCPSPVVRTTPCGVILVLDGPAMRQGKPLQIARINIQPQEGACAPAAYHPISMAIRDLDGDGKGELAFGHLGTFPGYCGVVHVFTGESLWGDVQMDDECARIEGPIVQPMENADQFGVAVELFHGGANKAGLVAIGSPYYQTTDSLPGKVEIFELPAACTGPGAPLVPSKVHEHIGSDANGLAGTDLGLVGKTLWVSSLHSVEGVSVETFERVGRQTPPGAFPIGQSRDHNGDGSPDPFFGPSVFTKEGDLLMHLGPFAQETFKGSFIGADQILSSDKFGMQLWALKDIWNPWLTMAADPPQVVVGETVDVSVVEMISLVPTPDPIRYFAAGGPIVDRNERGITVKALAPGEIVVEGSILGTKTLVRIPVLPPSEDYAGIVGPDIVEVGQPLAAHVHAPEGSTIQWTAAGGAPGAGTGLDILTTFDVAGPGAVHATVTLPGGAVKSLEHTFTVFAPDPGAPELNIDVPDAVDQGEPVEAAVTDPSDEAEYEWLLQGEDFGIATATGTPLTFPSWGAGNVTVTVIERVDGEVARMASQKLLVRNLPPEILALEIHTVDGVKAKVTARDPGGDNLTITWALDGKPVQQAPAIARELPPGDVTLTVLIQDSHGAWIRETRKLTITSSWQVVQPRNSSAPDPETTIDEYAWKVDRLRGSAQESGNEGGLAPSVPATWFLLAVAGAWIARRNAGRGR